MKLGAATRHIIAWFLSTTFDLRIDTSDGVHEAKFSSSTSNSKSMLSLNGFSEAYFSHRHKLAYRQAA